MPSDLVAVIKQKQAAIAKLQGELDEALALLSGRPRQSTLTLTTAKTQPARRAQSGVARKANAARAAKAARVHAAALKDVFPMGSVAKAVDVLREAGKPLYVMDIIKAIEERTGEKVKKDTLVGNLSRYIKTKKLFYRAGPNVFGLIGMEEK